MDSDEREFDKPAQALPGFSLVKYGSVLTLNFNQGFAQRLCNVLADSNKITRMPPEMLSVARQLALHLSEEDHQPILSKCFELSRFQHVYSLSFTREFGQQFNQVLVQFLTEHRISPALFSFSKQLEAALYPRKFDTRAGYADD